MRLELIAIGLISCASPIGLDGLDLTDRDELRFRAHDGYEVNALSCEIELTAQPELRDATQAAIDGWTQHVDCDMFLGDNGIPVTFADLEEARLGETNYRLHPNDPMRWKIGSIKIDFKTVDYDYVPTLKHELYHALGSIEHVAMGIGSKYRTIDYIDESSIEMVCRKVPCLEEQL